MATINVRRGDPLKVDVALKDPDTLDPLDLTGLTVWFTVKAAYPSDPTEDLDDASALVKAYWVDGGAALYLTTDDATTGVLKLRIPSSVTTTWAASSYHYDVQVELAADDQRTWDEGKFVVALDLTRRTTTP